MPDQQRNGGSGEAERGHLLPLGRDDRSEGVVEDNVHGYPVVRQTSGVGHGASLRDLTEHNAVVTKNFIMARIYSIRIRLKPG